MDLKVLKNAALISVWQWQSAIEWNLYLDNEKQNFMSFKFFVLRENLVTK